MELNYHPALGRYSVYTADLLTCHNRNLTGALMIAAPLHFEELVLFVSWLTIVTLDRMLLLLYQLWVFFLPAVTSPNVCHASSRVQSEICVQEKMHHPLIWFQFGKVMWCGHLDNDLREILRQHKECNIWTKQQDTVETDLKQLLCIESD